MNENARKTAGDQMDASIWKRKAGTFSLWDAFDLVYEENGLSEGLREALDMACKENGLPDRLRDEFSLAFEKNHPPDMLKSLIDLARDLDLETQAVVLRTLGEMGKRLPDGPARGVIAYFLARHLEHPEAEVRQAAVEAVGMLTRQVLTDALAIKLTSDESVRVRKASAEALGELAASPPLHALKEALGDEDWEVRATAIQALGSLGERLIIEPLKAALNDEDFSVRSAALHALGTFKGSLTTDYLVAVAQDEENDWITREAAVTALERAKEYGLAKTLRKKLDRELNEEFLAFPASEETLLVASSAPEKQRRFTAKYGMELHTGERRTRKEKSWFGEFFSHCRGLAVVLCMILVCFGGSALFSHASGVQSSRSPSIATSPSPSREYSGELPQNDASLIVLSPKSVAPGQQFSVHITAVNTGKMIWTDKEGYQLTCHIYAGHREIDCPSISGAVISPSVSGGGNPHVFVVSLVAPPTVGTYTLRWAMSLNGHQFGTRTDIQVHVSGDM